MRPTICLVALSFLADSVVNAVAVSGAVDPVVALQEPRDLSESQSTQELWKRKGGGGRSGGGGGGGSSGGRSSGSGSSGSGSSGSGSRSGSTGGGSRTSPSSNAGGSTRMGSGPAPSYGKGAFYGGGAKQPYRSGGVSPAGIAPFVLVGGVAAYAFWPGFWFHPPYLYPYHHGYTYRNRTNNQTETRNVLCGCTPYEVCGCDDNSNSTFLDDVIGNGSYAGLNKTLVNLAVVNGTETILLNGSLPNGTTAPGGEDDDEGSAAAGTLTMALRAAGWWPVVATVGAMVMLV